MITLINLCFINFRANLSLRNMFPFSCTKGGKHLHIHLLYTLFPFIQHNNITKIIKYNIVTRRMIQKIHYLCVIGQFRTRSTIFQPPPFQSEKDHKIQSCNNFDLTASIFPRIHLHTKISYRNTPNM